MQIYKGGAFFLCATHYTLVFGYFQEVVLHHLLLPFVLLGASAALLSSLARQPASRPETVTSLTTPHCRLCMCSRVVPAHHCATCNVCVIGFDHHCDIIDVCIATHNLQLFRAFVVYHACVAAYAVYTHFTYARKLHKLQESLTGLNIIITIELNIAITLTLFALFHLCLCVFGLRTIDVCRACTRALVRVQTRNRAIKAD